MGGCEAGSEDYARNEPALDALAVLNGHVTAINQRLLLRVAVSLRVCCRAAAEEGDEGLCCSC